MQEPHFFMRKHSVVYTCLSVPQNYQNSRHSPLAMIMKCSWPEWESKSLIFLFENFQWEKHFLLRFGYRFILSRVISSGRDGRDGATVLGDVGTNELQYVLLPEFGKELILGLQRPLNKERLVLIKKTLHHVDVQCLHCCHRNNVTIST